jgi:hypothetical protein
MTEKKRYIVKVRKTQTTAYQVEAWNPAHAKEEALKTEPPTEPVEVSPEEVVIRVKLDAPPKQKPETEIIGEAGESAPKKKQKK